MTAGATSSSLARQTQPASGIFVQALLIVPVAIFVSFVVIAAVAPAMRDALRQRVQRFWRARDDSSDAALRQAESTRRGRDSTESEPGSSWVELNSAAMAARQSEPAVKAGDVTLNDLGRLMVTSDAPQRLPRNESDVPNRIPRSEL